MAQRLRISVEGSVYPVLTRMPLNPATMDIPLDQFGGARPGLSAPQDTVRERAPLDRVGLDWTGLSARLAAAHATRQILRFRPGPGNGAAGSFAPGVARDLAAGRAAASRERAGPPSASVNLNAKADGKPLRTIGRIDAGEDRFLVRGLS